MAHDNLDDAALAEAPMPRYGVVILYFRRGREVLRTVEAALGQSLPPAQVVVVDNASGDGVLDALEPELGAAGVQVVTSSVNGGYAVGMNMGARALRSSVDHILLLTHEVVMDPRCVERLLQQCSNSGAVLVGPSLRLPGGGVWSNGGRLSRMGSAVHMRNAGTSESPLVAWLDGACLLARRDAMAAAGGFDERYFLYWEDVDFSLAMGEAGRVMLVPQAVAYQSPSADAPMYYYSRNRLLLWRKHRRRLLELVSIPAILAYAVSRVVRGHPGDVRQALRGIRDGLAGRTGPDPVTLNGPPSV